MTLELAQTRISKHPPGPASILLTRFVLFWERAWPALLPVLAIPYILAVMSLYGVWRYAPGWLHLITLILAALAAAHLLWRTRGDFSWPSKRKALARLEEDGRAPHTPLQALDDKPFLHANQNSPLWEAHRAASLERAKQARLGRIRDVAAEKDPFGLRFTALGLLIIAMLTAGDQWRDRLVSALAPSAAGSGLLMADLWIEPPAYTGKAPIYLMRAGEPVTPENEQINTAQGARLVSQINNQRRPKLSFITGEVVIRAPFEKSTDAARAEISLKESGLLMLSANGKKYQWPIGIRPDGAPFASFVTPPYTDDRGLLAFSFSAVDDYNITSARLEYRLDPDQSRPLDAPAFDEAALSEIRRLEIPGAAGSSGEHHTALDLQADPWAGLHVLARVVASDGAGQTGVSEEKTVQLPTRQFFNPLAKVCG